MRRRALPLAVMLAGLVTLVAASPTLAMSLLQEDFLPFQDCPAATSSACLIANTTSGEFVLDHKTVQINKTITLQGGLASSAFTAQPLLGALDGDTLSKTPLTVPGGLVGIEGLGGEVTATAEIAGPASSVIVNRADLLLHTGAAVTLPLKVKLDNPVLGEECYIGSDSDPILLHLTDGSTSPPFPAKSITGAFTPLEGVAKGKIKVSKYVSLVDNDFSVPGASGCGGALSFLVDPAVDLIIGIPAPAGFSKAEMNGSLEETAAEFVLKYKAKAKKVKK